MPLPLFYFIFNKRNAFLLLNLASVDLRNGYDEWCRLIERAQHKARCLLQEYDTKFASLKVIINMVCMAPRALSLYNYWENPGVRAIHISASRANAILEDLVGQVQNTGLKS